MIGLKLLCQWKLNLDNVNDNAGKKNSTYQNGLNVTAEKETSTLKISLC